MPQTGSIAVLGFIRLLAAATGRRAMRVAISIVICVRHRKLFPGRRSGR